MDYFSLGAMTGACHAPVDSRQGKALTDTNPTAAHGPPFQQVETEKSADLEMDGRENFLKSSLPVGGGIEANTVAEMLTVTPYFEDVGTTYKPKKTAEASAEAAYPLGKPTVLCSRRMKVS